MGPEDLGRRREHRGVLATRGQRVVGVIGMNTKRGCSGDWGCNVTDPEAIQLNVDATEIRRPNAILSR